MNRPMQTTFRHTIFIAACLALLLSACGKNNNSEEEIAAMLTTVSGSVAYRERIALTPGHTLKVSLSDVSVTGNAAPAVAEVSRLLQDEQVPLSFEIQVEGGELLPDHQYQVRAVLQDPSGEVIWATDVAYPIDPAVQTQDLGTLQLFMVDRSDGQPEQQENVLAGTSWQVEDVASGGVIDNANLTINFDEDGKVNGSSGCNRYMGEYTVKGYEIELGQVAGTMMACAPALMDLERKFLDVLGGAIDFSIDWERSKLTITAWDGQDITAAQIQ